MPIGAAIGGGFNLLSSALNNINARKREQEARKENFEYGEKAANAADQRTRALYNDLYSAKAQMEQLKDAGLSPSIFSSGGLAGKSGVSGAQGGGAAGVQPNVFGIDPVNAALATAQIKKLNAETNKTDAETKNISEDTKLKSQMILNIVADTKNKGVEHRLLTAQSEIAEIKAEQDAATLQTNIERAYHNTTRAAAEARSAINKADLDEATFQVSYELAYANLEQTLTETELLETEIGVNKAQIKEIAERIRNSQWQTWTMEKEQYRKDAIFYLDQAKFQAEVKKWANEQNIELTKAKLNMVSDLVGYVCNFAQCGLTNVTKLKQTDMYTQAKKDIANKPTKEVSSEAITDSNGNIITKTKTKNKF